MTTRSTPVRGRREIVALGEEVSIDGLALVGVRLRPASTVAEVHDAWSDLLGAGLVILTPGAAEALGDRRWCPGAPLTVVMPP